MGTYEERQAIAKAMVQADVFETGDIAKYRGFKQSVERSGMTVSEVMDATLARMLRKHEI